jgi:uncharacterized protein YcaQ
LPGLSIDDLRRYAVARTLFAPTTLPRAIDRLGFVQADPIRAPARAQDLTLRHRVKDYRAGDLEKRYPKLGLEEDFFVNYGFLPRATHDLMHPRQPLNKWTKASNEKAAAILEYVRANGVVHPRDVDAHFQHGRVTNWFGGSSSASTQLLDGMHYRGLLRVAGRESGTRLYAAREATAQADDADAAMDKLIDVIVNKYAPLPLRSLGELVYHLRRGAIEADWSPPRSTACSGFGRRARSRNPGAGRRDRATTRRRVSLRRSIRSSGIAAASRCSGAGPIVSKRTRRPPSVCGDITRCRCCGAIRSSAGAIFRSWMTG